MAATVARISHTKPHKVTRHSISDNFALNSRLAAWPSCKFLSRESSEARLRLPNQPPRKRCSRSASTLAALSLGELPTAILSSTPGLQAGFFVNTTVFMLGIKVLLAGLTPAGVLHSWFLGTAVYAAFGPCGYGLVCLYFILGSLATKLKLQQKELEGIAEARSGRRAPPSVWGSGIAAVACAIASFFTPSSMLPLWRIGFVASLGSKLNDTTASEVGKAYGKTTYLSTTFKPVPRGTEGAVSLEGTLAGAGASVLISALALASNQVDAHGFFFCVVAAFLANTFESWLGASVQGNVEWMTNDVVNMIQITVAAAIAMILYLVFPGALPLSA